MATLNRIQPEGWAEPVGYANGVVGEGKILFVAGQIGWTADQRLVSDLFAEQFRQALKNVLRVVATAGGRPASIARMTVFVSDKQAYIDSRKQIGRAWRELLGAHYPAMALLEVQSLLEPGALVEIEATAVL